MKLLLASDGEFLIKEGYGLLGVPTDKIRIGYVTTASKGASDDEYIKTHKKMMQEGGFYYEEIDIEGKTKEELKLFFSDKNIVHVEGGNTLYLLRAVKKSGFDNIIKELLDKGVVYVGTSAGSSITGPTIEFSSHVPMGTSTKELQALDLIPFLFKAHYTDDKQEQYLEKMKSVRYPVKFFRDGQGILVENNKYTFVGSGQEVKLSRYSF